MSINLCVIQALESNYSDLNRIMGIKRKEIIHQEIFKSARYGYYLVLKSSFHFIAYYSLAFTILRRHAVKRAIKEMLENRLVPEHLISMEHDELGWAIGKRIRFLGKLF